MTGLPGRLLASGSVADVFVCAVVEALDLPMPAVRGIVQVGGRWGVAFDRVDAPSFAEQARTNSWLPLIAATRVAEGPGARHVQDHPAGGGRRGRGVELHHQALLAARHGEVALGEQPRVGERAVQDAVRAVDQVALAQRVERVLLPRVQLFREEKRIRDRGYMFF